MTAILAVNGDKLPCGCPLSSLTIDRESILDLIESFKIGSPKKYTRCICKNHPNDQIFQLPLAIDGVVGS